MPTTAPPANAVALCGDGTFIVEPADVTACNTRRGVRVAIPPRLPGRPPAAEAWRPSMAPAALLNATSANAPPPDGATMRCKDGTYLYGTPAESRCSLNGGVAAILVQEQAEPPPPVRPRIP